MNYLSSAELILPYEEMEFLSRCSTTECDGSIQVRSQLSLEKMRLRARFGEEEPTILCCSKCQQTFSISNRLDCVLEYGHRRCFGRGKLSNEEVIDLKWRGFCSKPNMSVKIAYDRWLLEVASVQCSVNLHDWKHRTSCFKKGGDQCRYKIPSIPVADTIVVPVCMTCVDSKLLRSSIVTSVEISIKCRPSFVLFTECNILFLAVINYNNCTRYVENQKVSMYLGAYVTKLCTENEKELGELIRVLNAYMERTDVQQKKIGFTQRGIFKIIKYIFIDYHLIVSF